MLSGIKARWLLRQARDASRPLHERRSAVEALENLQCPRAVAGLEAILADREEDAGLRLIAAISLARTGNATGSKYLLSLLRSKKELPAEVPFGMTALKVLIEQRVPGSVTILVDFVKLVLDRPSVNAFGHPMPFDVANSSIAAFVDELTSIDDHRMITPLFRLIACPESPYSRRLVEAAVGILKRHAAKVPGDVLEVARDLADTTVRVADYQEHGDMVCDRSYSEKVDCTPIRSLARAELARRKSAGSK